MKILASRNFSNLVLISVLAFIAISPLYFYGALSVQITTNLNYRPSLHGFGTTAFYLVAAIFAISLGRKADYADPVFTLKTSMLITCLISIGISISNSLQEICVFLAIGGIGNALATPGIAKFVNDQIDKNSHGLAYGFKQSATGLSTLVGAAAIPFVATGGQWRIVFLIGALISLAIFLSLQRRSVELDFISNWRIYFSRNFEVSSARKRYTLEVKLIAISFGLGAAVGAGLITYLPLSNAELGLNPAQSSFTIGLASFSSLITRFLVLQYMDRTKIDAIKICIGMMALGALGLIGISTMKTSYITISALISYAFGWGWIGLITYKMLRISEDNIGANVGLVQSAAAVGSIIGPITLASIYEFSGFQLMWQISSIALFASLLLLVYSQLAGKAGR